MKKYIEPSIICRIVVPNKMIANSPQSVSFNTEPIDASKADAKFLGDMDEEDEDFGF